MKRTKGQILFLLFIFGIWGLISSGCTLKASTESLTDTFTNFSSSTSGSSWFTEDGLVKEEEKVKLFVMMNYENLQHDLAQGRGEYLTSLETLLGIPNKDMTRFERLVQRKSSEFQQSPDPSPLKLLALLSNLSSTSP